MTHSARYAHTVYRQNEEIYELKTMYSRIKSISDSILQGVHGGWKNWRNWKLDCFLNLGWKN